MANNKIFLEPAAINLSSIVTYVMGEALERIDCTNRKKESSSYSYRHESSYFYKTIVHFSWET